MRKLCLRSTKILLDLGINGIYHFLFARKDQKLKNSVTKAATSLKPEELITDISGQTKVKPVDVVHMKTWDVDYQSHSYLVAVNNATHLNEIKNINGLYNIPTC